MSAAPTQRRPRRDLYGQIGVVLLAVGVGIQLPAAGALADDNLLMSVPPVAIGAFLLCFRLSMGAAVAAAGAAAGALWILACRQGGMEWNDVVMMFTLPVSIAAALALSRARKFSGAGAVAASCVLGGLILGITFAPWPDLITVFFAAAILALRSAPFPGALPPR